MQIKYLTESETAKLLDVSPATIQRWRQQGKIPFKIIKHKVYFDKKEILNWAKEHDFSIPVAASEQSEKIESGYFLHEAVKKGGIYPNVEGNDVYSVLENALKKITFITPADSALLLDELLKREELASTSVGKGVAIPHPRNRMELNLSEAHIPVFFLQNPIEYNSLDGQAVSTLFLLLTTNTKEHLKLLAKISYLLGNRDFLSALQDKNKNNDLIDKIKALENG